MNKQQLLELFKELSATWKAEFATNGYSKRCEELIEG